MKLLLLVRSDGRPTAALTAAANHSENKLVEPLLEAIGVQTLPEVLLADAAYDDDRLRDDLAEQGVFLLAPHRRNRKRPARYDGRNMRRYRRRYIVERTNSWLQAFRRLPTRYEFYPDIYTGFVSLACLILTVRGL